MALFMTLLNYPGHTECKKKKCGCSFSVIHLGFIWQHLVQQKITPARLVLQSKRFRPEGEGADSHSKALCHSSSALPSSVHPSLR